MVGTTWDAQDLTNNQVAQLYGGYVLPGSQLDVPGGVGLVVSQWDTATGWPYRTMQFRVTLNDTTGTAAVPKVHQHTGFKANTGSQRTINQTEAEEKRLTSGPPGGSLCDVCDRRFGTGLKHGKVHKRAAGAPPRTPRRGLIQTGFPSRAFAMRRSEVPF